VTARALQNIQRFQHVIAGRFGLHFDDFKLNFVIDVLQRRSESKRMTPEEYIAALETVAHHNGEGEWRELARELTVGESYFFRNEEQFHALREVALPARMRARQAARMLTVASIGCSSGEEPYTIAIVIRELLPSMFDWGVRIVAVDVNPEAIEKARAGRYSAWSLRGTPDAVRERWFTADGRDFVIDESIRRMVSFEERNVAGDDARFWSGAMFDIVFCRNMLMYFTPQAAQDVVDRICRSLLPGGFFFLGHAETLRGLSREFHLRHTHDTFYYQKRTEEEQTLLSAPGAADTRGADRTPLAEMFESAESWVETISRSAERIRSLTERTPTRSAPASAPARQVATFWDLAPAFQLLRDERYDDALALVDELPADSARNADVLALRAVLLAHRGDLVAAEDVCRQILAIDELSAGAHYLMALCREGARDRAGAIDHDQTAVYLDPSFAAPRLHLGLLARKSGDRAAARRDLAQAMVLLEREDVSRLLLFGGGFSREALIDLCRAELAACGGLP
jgi:chemotaxis protein methyltransferase CheR